MEENLAANLKKHVRILSSEIGKRNYLNPHGLRKAAGYIKYTLSKCRCNLDKQIYNANGLNIEFENIIAEKKSNKSKDILVVGAHYDTYAETPGADDNASGVAVLLELASLLSKETFAKTLRFVAFANEEPPFFKSASMGSLRYAELCKKAGEKVEFMICLESVGYFSSEENSQKYPFPLKYFYPDKGDFISIVSNMPSKNLMKRCADSFRKASSLRVEHLSAPQSFVPHIALSDQWSFWKQGYKAVMVSDTAFLRTPYYHTKNDTPEKLDYEKMVEVVKGTKQAIEDLAK